MLFVTCKRNLNGKNGMLRWLGLGLLLGTGFGIAWAQGLSSMGSTGENLLRK
jgi:hypothetical protein